VTLPARGDDPPEPPDRRSAPNAGTPPRHNGDDPPEPPDRRSAPNGGTPPRPGTTRAGRDRDSAGRPRNARPRDELGRPLPRGTPGAERVPEDLLLPPAQSLALAQQLLDDGRPFHAHEVLEASWKHAPTAERELWRGLAQLAVGLTHAQRGNARGAAALLRRGAERVGGYAEAAPHDIDAAGLSTACAALAERIDAAGLAGLDPPPHLALTRRATLG
jgi:uncharacterized protein